MTHQVDDAVVPANSVNKRQRTYRVKAVWKTLQGEGVYAGRPAVFVRFVGCNIWSGYEVDRQRDANRTGADCPLWCDTDFTKEGSQNLTASALADAIEMVGGAVSFCVLTGGEPLLQVDADLIRALRKNGFYVAAETNGTVRLKDACWDASSEEVVSPDWIVCSPKLPEESLRIEYFDELKLVVPDYMPNNYRSFAARRRIHEIRGTELPTLWMQPEDGPRFEEAKQIAIREALNDPAWRVSVQTHKVLGVE